MKKKHMHQIIIDPSGFYVFERGLGFYHDFDKVTRVKLESKLKDVSFFVSCTWVVLISIALYLIWSFDLWVCVLFCLVSLFVAYRWCSNKYILKIVDVNGVHYYEMKRKSDPLEVKINEIQNRISKDRFLKDIERTSKNAKLQHF